MKKYKKSKGARPLFFHLRWLRLPLKEASDNFVHKYVYILFFLIIALNYDP